MESCLLKKQLQKTVRKIIIEHPLNTSPWSPGDQNFNNFKGKRMRFVLTICYPYTHASHLASGHLESPRRPGFNVRECFFLLEKNSRLFAYICMLTFKHMESYIKISLIASCCFGGKTQVKELLCVKNSKLIIFQNRGRSGGTIQGHINLKKKSNLKNPLKFTNGAV